jgi:hypothetical protein
MEKSKRFAVKGTVSYKNSFYKIDILYEKIDD